MDNLQKQYVQREINQLIRSIRQEQSSDVVLRLFTTRPNPQKLLSIIGLAMLMGGLLVFIFLPLANANKLFNSHLLPIMDLTPNHATMFLHTQRAEDDYMNATR